MQAHGEVHPRQVNDHFAHGTVTNYWGGSSSATTHLLDAMHYAGLLRVARREAGIRIYAAREPSPGPADADARRARVDALVDVLVSVYAPLPARSLSDLVSRLRYASPQWQRDLKPALARARSRLAHARVDGIDWFWPSHQDPATYATDREARLLAPFDPIVWDRRRFEHLWGWAYRFEAYTPVRKRQLGYYALPLLWDDRIVGWGNLSVVAGNLQADFGYAGGSPPADRAFAPALEDELSRMRAFLGGRWAERAPTRTGQRHVRTLTARAVSLLQRVQVCGDVAGVLLADAHLRHGRFLLETVRMPNPADQQVGLSWTGGIRARSRAGNPTRPAMRRRAPGPTIRNVRLNGIHMVRPASC